MENLRRGLSLLCVLALAGCGLGENEERRWDGIADSDLAIMVLPQTELGALAEGFKIDADGSGPVDSKEAAEDTVDPEDTAASLTEKGWITGYELLYSSPKPRKRGFVAVQTTVELFRDDVYASEYLDKQLDDLARARKIEAGVKVTGVSKFDVVGVGDEASGLRATLKGPGVKFRVTLAAFRRARIVGAAMILRADRRDASSEAQRLAATLDGRILGVVNGGVRDEPVALPTTSKPKPGQKPRRSIDPKRLTLKAEDLPAGTSVAGEGYKRHGDVRSYLREFNLPGDQLGGSRVVYLRAMAQVLETREAAKDYFFFADTREGAEELARVFARGVLKIRPRNMLAGPIPTRRSDTAALIASFEAPRGRVAVAMVLVRSGSAVGSLTALGMGNEVDPSDVAALADEIRARLRR